MIEEEKSRIEGVVRVEVRLPCRPTVTDLRDMLGMLEAEAGSDAEVTVAEVEGEALRSGGRFTVLSATRGVRIESCDEHGQTEGRESLIQELRKGMRDDDKSRHTDTVMALEDLQRKIERQDRRSGR